MSNTPSKENVRKKSQRGVALLFALGILGLLLVMALGFATNSIFDQLIASNSSSNSSAKAIANSGLERARLIIQNYSDTMPLFNTTALNFTTNGIFGYSHSGDTTVFTLDTSNFGNSSAKSDMLADNRFFGTYTTWTADMTNNINWIYLKSDNRIIGRMAYIILNRADLDPARLVKSSVDESYTALAEPQELRLGAEPNEINLRTIDSGMTEAMAQNFNYTTNATSPGKFNGNSWVSLSFLFNQFGLADATWQGKFTRWFICNSQNSPEAFWIDNNGDGKVTADEQFHRFNLTRTDWGTAFNTKEKVYENILLDKNPLAPDGEPDQPPKLYTNSGTEDGYGIPWLALFGYKTDGTVDTALGATFGNSAAGVIARRRQIAANLVDYCMPLATTATSDQSDWLANTPTFTGNKKTPYINEFGGEVHLSTVILPNVPKFDITTTMNFYLYSELINIYAADWTATNIRLNVKGSFTYDYEIGKSGLVQNQQRSFNVDINAADFAWRNGYGSNKKLVDTVTLSDLNVPAGFEKATVDNVIFKIDSAILYVPGVSNIFYDYANVNKSSTLPVKLEDNYTTVTTPDEQHAWFSIETEDPRQNLNTGDWTAKTAEVQNGGALFYVWTAVDASGLRGAVNSNSNPSGRATDAETVTDPAYVSAAAHLSIAYIRQGPIVSPWELGFIHRGEKWQTLNLHKYDANKTLPASAITVNGNKYWAGGGAYASGDANILDQIKMNSSASNYKIDLNNEYDDTSFTPNRRIVLYSLFKNIKSGCDMSDTAPEITGGAAISDTSINHIIDSIAARSGTGLNIYQTRAHVVNDMIAGSSPIPGYTTKALQDEIIGKTINLVDFDSYYTVILVVQTIRDVGGPVGTPILINKKLSGDAANTAVTAELGKFDMVVNGGKNYYADDITSTLKVQAVVHKKIDGTCEILSVKYIQ